MKLIYLEWEDASSANGWHTPEEVKEFLEEAVIVYQVGWVYEETKRTLLLISRHAPNGIFTNDGDVAYGNLQRIPKTWIRKRIDLTSSLRKPK